MIGALQIKHQGSPYLLFASEPVGLSQLVKQYRLVISYGGHGSILLSGIPILIRYQQNLLGYRLADQGLAVVVKLTVKATGNK